MEAGRTTEREREAAPTLHLIKVLKQRDQKKEKRKQNKFRSCILLNSVSALVFICLIFDRGHFGENGFFVSQVDGDLSMTIVLNNIVDSLLFRLLHLNRICILEHTHCVLYNKGTLSCHNVM